MEWESVGRLTYSPRKVKILKLLSKSPPSAMTPTQIAKATGIKLSNTSDTLKELASMKLVEMVTPPNMRKGKLFAITRKGKGVVKVL